MKKELLVLLGFLFSHYSIFSQTLVGSGTISLTSTSTPYSQNFNSLVTPGPSNVLPNGWYFIENGGDNFYVGDDGSSNSGDTYSYGLSGNISFGTLRDPSQSTTIGSNFSNNTGGTVTQLNVTYVGKEWSNNLANGISDKLIFEYSTDATSLSNGTWTGVTQLDFLSPVNTSIGQLDGNASPNNTALSFSISGLSLINGGNFWIRWRDFQVSGTEDGLAIDDFTIQPLTSLNTVLSFNPPSSRSIGYLSNGYNVYTSILNPSTTVNTTVQAVLTGAGTGLASDLIFSSPYTITFLANTSTPQFFKVKPNYTNQTGSKTYVFQLQNPAGGTNASINNTQNTFTLTINFPPPPMYYRSLTSGSWTSPSTWQISPDSITWSNSSTSTPTYLDNSILIQNSHVVTLSSTIDIDQTTIAVGGVLQLNNSTSSLSLKNGKGDDLIIKGKFLHSLGQTPIFAAGVVMHVFNAGIVEIADNTNGQEIYGTSNQVTYDNGSQFLWSAGSSIAGGIFFPNAISPIVPIFYVSNTISSISTSPLTINGDLFIANSSIMNLSGVNGLSLTGNFTNNGGFNANLANTTFNGTAAQNIFGSSNTIFYDLTVSNSVGLKNEANTSIKHVLTLTGTSKIDVDGASNNQVFTLISDASGDASIAPVPAGASLTGSLNVQRFLANPIAGREYRYMSSPVSNATVSQWKSIIPITGIFADPSSGVSDGRTLNTTFPSLYYYDENKAFTLNDKNKGATGYPGSGTLSSDPTNALLNVGKGYLLFVRNSSTTPTLLNLQGTPNIGNISIPFTYSDVVPSNSQAGWNFIGNPYAAPISWNAIVGLSSNSSIFPTKLDNTVYIRDNANIGGNGAGTMYSFVANGISTPAGFNGNIASGQGFYVHASGSGSLNLDESVKSSPATFYRTSGIPNDLIRISLVGSVIRDETVIYFDNKASDRFDSGFDAYKWKNDAVNISTICSAIDTNRLSINGSSFSSCHKEFKIAAHSKISGSYRLDFSDFENFDKGVSITLIDSISNKQVDVRSNKVYNFNIDNNSNVYEKTRFKLVFEKQGLEPTFSQNGLTLISNIKTGNQWIKDGKLIAGATNKTYEVTSDGSYSLIVKYSDGCVGTSNERIMAVTGIENNSLDNNIIIFPNPVVKDLNINFNLKNGKSLLSTIFNITGGMVFEKILLPKNNGSQFVIENLNLKSGTYILKLVDGNDSKFLKFIKD